ncbi:hypothetical protein H2199_001806 [Coniosporium tulheliwenetii]|uniref:Uncharacterized protein n=1 Tax=Coniosporium tulheliwenetii TaxID=3383036 RepID=A0ACC2ZL01_9PEZI|nr:hypothetical protein H2199_001806 [Cladosporium sp. JES 115]
MATATATTTATAYKVEELLALRDSVSESAVSLEKFGDEDAIKDLLTIPLALRFVSSAMADSFNIDASKLRNGASDFLYRAAAPADPIFKDTSGLLISPYDFVEHVLRPSASNNTIGSRKENAGPPSLAPNRALGQAMNDARSVSLPYKRLSPTPSYKRGRAEKLLKEHGSPPTLRVTAGGRVVPNDVPALGSPRYSQNLLAGSNTSRTASPPRAAQAAVNNIPCGTLAGDNQYQYMYGQWMPLVNWNGITQLYMEPPTSIQMPPQLQPMPFYNQTIPPFMYPQQPMAAAPPQPLGATYPQMNIKNLQSPALENMDIASQIRHLEAEYERHNNDHKELLKQEVLQQDHLDSTAREAIVKEKRSYVTRLDTIRKNIKALKETQARAAAGIIDPSVSGQPPAEQPLFAPLPPRGHAMPPQASLPASAFPPAADGVVSPMAATFGVSSFSDGPATQPQIASRFQLQNATASFPPVSAGGKFNHTGGVALQPFQGSGTISRSPKARPHALEVKAPTDSAKPGRGLRSSLNPTSPTYEPRNSLSPDVQSPGIFVPPSPSPVASPPANKALLEKQPWLFSHHNEVPAPKPTESRSIHEPSISSVSTTDFFPNNPYDHSAIKSNEGQNSDGQRRVSASTCRTAEASAPNGHPVTPQKGYGPTPRDNQASSKSQEEFHSSAPPVSPADTRSPSYSKGMQAEHERPAQLARPELHHFGMSAETVPWSTVSVAGSVSTPRGESGQFGYAQGPNGVLDFTTKSSSFLDGYSAGLAGLPIVDSSDTELLSGYIAGLQKVKSANALSPTEPVSTGVQSRQASFLNVYHAPSYQPGPTHFPIHPFADLRHPAPIAPVSTATLGLNIHAMGISRTPTPGGVSINGLFPGMADPLQPTLSATTFKPLLSRQQSKASVHLEQVAVSSSQQTNNNTKASKSFPCMPFPRAYSGNQIQPQGSGRNNGPFTRHYQGKKVYGQHSDGTANSSANPSGHGPVGRPSQYDGAMDDLAEMVLPVRLSPRRDNASPSIATGSPKKSPKKRHPTSPGKAFDPLVRIIEGSPSKAGSAEGSETEKKTKRENTNNDEMPEVDPARLSRAEKKSWRENWKKRFQEIKSKEREEIEQYRRENPLDN